MLSLGRRLIESEFKCVHGHTYIQCMYPKNITLLSSSTAAAAAVKDDDEEQEVFCKLVH